MAYLYLKLNQSPNSHQSLLISINLYLSPFNIRIIRDIRIFIRIIGIIFKPLHNFYTMFTQRFILFLPIRTNTVITISATTTSTASGSSSF